MPNGEANVTGNIFELPQADRHSAGIYRCAADNRVGVADTRDTFVNVLCKFELALGSDDRLNFCIHPQLHQRLKLNGR